MNETRDSLNEIVYFQDLEGKISHLNHAVERVTGYSRLRVSHDPLYWRNVLHPDDLQAIDRLLASPRSSKEPIHVSYRIKARDGTWKKLESTRHPVFDADGALTGWDCVDRDLTKLVDAIRELRESEELYRGLFEGALDATFIVDTKRGIILDCNQAACDLVGRDRADLVGKHQSILHPEESLSGDCSATFVEHRDRLSGAILEDRVLRKDGTIREVEIRASHIKTGRQDLMLGSFRDVTEPKRLERELLQAQKMENLGRLAGGIAHDFNNLLAVILNYAGFVQDQLPEGTQNREDIDEVIAAGKRAAALTRQLLAFSRQRVSSPRLLDLNQEILTLHKMLKRTVGEDIELATIPAAQPAPVIIDPVQVQQLVMNLVVNGRDAMPAGGRLSIEIARRHTGSGGEVIVVVSDTGCGMDEETMARIFDPFFTTKEVGRGTGLGLATCSAIMGEVGGTIEVDSHPGTGTSITLRFPAATVEPAAPEVLPSTASDLRVEGVALVAEDDPAVRGMLRRILVRTGLVVLVATDGENALEVAANHPGPIDLLLTDVVMPLRSGLSVAKELSQRRPPPRTIFMSGYGAIKTSGEFTPQAIFLPKPFTAGELIEAVSRILGSR